MSTTDQDLLQAYATNASEPAFRQLVERHLGLVYAAARRLVYDPHAAEDITQDVFTLLAKKAGKLGPEVVVAGWLYKATRQVASEWSRRERRRTHRERVAMETVELHANDDWRAIEPLLELAMARLSQVDRDAVVLRYFENQSLRDVGCALGISDDAAQKRLSRALDKLRQFFGRHGKAITASSVAAALASGAIEAPPVALGAVISSTALASASTCLVGSGLLNTLAIMKTQVAIATATAAVMTLPLAFQQRTVNQLRQENLALSQSPATPADASLAFKVDADELQQLRKEHTELMRLRSEVGLLRRDLAAAQSSAQGTRNSSADSVAPIQPAISLEAQAAQLSHDTINVMKNLGLAARIYSTDHADAFPTNFTQMTNELPAKFAGNLSLEGFEFVPQPRTISEREPELILFRERVPRQLPDGRWARAYTLADGSTVEQISNDGNFDAFENAHLASGPLPAPTPGGAYRIDEKLLQRYGLKQ